MQKWKLKVSIDNKEREGYSFNVREKSKIIKDLSSLSSLPSEIIWHYNREADIYFEIEADNNFLAHINAKNIVDQMKKLDSVFFIKDFEIKE